MDGGVFYEYDNVCNRLQGSQRFAARLRPLHKPICSRPYKPRPLFLPRQPRLYTLQRRDGPEYAASNQRRLHRVLPLTLSACPGGQALHLPPLSYQVYSGSRFGYCPGLCHLLAGYLYLKFTLYKKQRFPQICSRKTFSKFNLLFLNEITLVFNLKYKMYGN